MTRRATFLTAIMLSVLLMALAVAAAACGSADETTTTAPTTAAPGATATTAAGGGGVPALTPEITAYLMQMQALFSGLETLPGTADPMSVTDISKVTDADIEAFGTTLAQIDTALDGLEALKPPAELAAFQEALIAAINTERGAVAKAIDALKDKDQAAFDAAKAEADKLEGQLDTVLDQLAPLMGGATPAS